MVVAQHTELTRLVRSFLTRLERNGRSPKTIENYAHYLERFLAHTNIGHPTDITIPLVTRYRTLLTERYGLAAVTVNYHLTALRMFLRYLRTVHRTGLEPRVLRLVRAAPQSLAPLTRSELERLLAIPRGDGIKDLRDNALLHLLFSTGVRVSELCSLNTDVALARNTIPINTGRGVRAVPLSDVARRAVRAYLNARVDTDPALFITVGRHKSAAHGARLTPRSVQRIVRHHALQAGIPHEVTTHSIRSVSGQR